MTNKIISLSLCNTVYSIHVTELISCTFCEIVGKDICLTSFKGPVVNIVRWMVIGGSDYS